MLRFDIHIFYKVMALFWTLAEGLIFVYLRWGFLSLKGEKRGQRVVVPVFVAAFLLLTVLIFAWKSLLGPFLHLDEGIHLTIYRKAVWSFFCTIWIVLEGMIMVYVLRLYRLVNQSLKKKDKNAPGSFSPGREFAYGIPAVLLALFGLFLFYEYLILRLEDTVGLTAEHVRHLSLFYVRICGLFWIAFEWIVAFIGVKTYLVLKRTGRSVP